MLFGGEVYKIKEFSAMTGLSPSSIRFYEKHGLFECSRTANGYRSFSPNDAFQSNAFRTLLKYGFSIDEAARLLHEKQGCEEFAESLRSRKVQMQHEMKELQIRVGQIDRALHHLEDEEDGMCLEVEEQNFLYARASNGLDFNIAKHHRLAIAEYYEMLGLTFCSRVIAKADLESDSPTLDPSYVISIKEENRHLLSAEALDESELIELGHCVFFRREVTREESVQRTSYAPLYEYLDAHDLAIKGDALLFPLFLNLDGEGRDVETVYVPVEPSSAQQ